MARGKHKRTKASKDAHRLAQEFGLLTAELETERIKLAQAEQRVREVEELRAELEQTVAERDANVAPTVARLKGQNTILSEVLADASKHREAIQDAWDEVCDDLTDRLGGGAEGHENLVLLVAGRHPVLTDTHQRGMPLEQVQRLQMVRGQRRSFREAKPLDAHASSMVPLRKRWREIYQQTDLLDLPASERETHILALSKELQPQVREADSVSTALLNSTVTATSLDAIHYWHPSRSIMLDLEEPNRAEIVDQLGACGASLLPGPSSLATVGAPTPILTYAGRSGIAAGAVEDFHQACAGDLERDVTLIRAADRLTAPWQPLPAFPAPGDAIALRYWYKVAALGSWSQYSDYLETDAEEAQVPSTQSARDAMAQAAVGLASAVPFWLPSGQAYGYADSEPLRAQDLEEIRLPFPQVFVAAADPLRLPAVDEPDAETQAMLGELDAVVMESLRKQGEQWTVLTHQDAPLDYNLWNKVPPLSCMLTVRGARVEGLLLLGDTMGRLSDDFAWCLAIPSDAGGVHARVVVPAKRSRTAWSSVVENFAAACAWADWHEADSGLGEIASAREARQAAGMPSFRKLYGRGGAGGVRVLNVKRTGGDARAKSAPTGRTLAPHVRRGHWRRQHHGPEGSLIKRVRIAPVLVNASKGDLAPRVYRLPGKSHRSVDS
ncbi:hypothetical protein ACQEU3_14820 [Spirillospora sp. CA-253888]